MAHYLRPMRTSDTVNRVRTDAGDWYRCPRCDFPIKLSRTSTPAWSGITVEDAITASDVVGTLPQSGGNLPVESVSRCYADEEGITGGMVKLGDNDTAIVTYYTPRTFTATSGCPACGQVWLER